MSASIGCPGCGYDLSAAQASVGACPECGDRFDVAKIDARRHAGVSWSLLVIGAGALLGVAAVAVGGSFAYMPRANEGSAGSGEQAARVLALLPFLAVAYGVIALGADGKRGVSGCWPMVVACVFAVAAIVRLNGPTGNTWANFPRWLQPGIWTMIADWTLLVAEGALVVAAAHGLRRVANGIHSARLRRWAGCLIVFGVAALILRPSTRLHGMYVVDLANSSGPAIPPPFLQSAALTSSLYVLNLVIWWMMWPALGLVALHLRALHKASR